MIFFTYKTELAGRKKSLIGYLMKMLYQCTNIFWYIAKKMPKKYFGQTPLDNWYRSLTSLDCLFPLGEIEFEGRMYPSPRDYGQHLEALYGKNYLTPLSEDKRYTHAQAIMIDD